MNDDDQHPYATSLVRIKKYRKRPTIPSLFLNYSSENVVKQFENLNDGDDDKNIDSNYEVNDINNLIDENEHELTAFEKTVAWFAQQQKFFNRILKGNFSSNSSTSNSTNTNVSTKNSSHPNLKPDSLDIDLGNSSANDDRVLIAVCECGNASLYQTLARRRDENKKSENSVHILLSQKKQKQQKKSILEPEVATSVHKVVPQLVLYWEVVGLVGTCIARRCAGWRT